MANAPGFSKLAKHVRDVANKLLDSDIFVLSEIAERMLAAKKSDAVVFTAGNGGSCAAASHMVNDLVKGCAVNGNPGFRAVCLADSSAVVTCISNDFSYDEVFSVQLKSLARSGDLLVLFSGSGNSPNIINAIEYAAKSGISTIAFGGGDGGRMKSTADICMIAPTDIMEEIEDMHMVYEHALVTYLRERLSAEAV